MGNFFCVDVENVKYMLEENLPITMLNKIFHIYILEKFFEIKCFSDWQKAKICRLQSDALDFFCI